MFTLFRQRERIDHLAFSPSGLTLAAAAVPRGASVSRVRLWDLAAREPLSLLDPAGGVASLTFVRDDATLVLQRVPEDQLYLLDVSTGETRALFDPDDETVPFWFAAGDDGETVLAAYAPRPGEDSNSGVDVWQVDVSTDRQSRVAQFATRAPVANLAFRAGNPMLLAVEERPFRLVVLSPGRLPEEIKLRRDARLSSLAFVPGGRTLALRGSRSLLLWDVDARQMIGTLSGPPTFHAMAFSPDGGTLAIGTSDGLVRFYEVASLRQRAAFDWQIGPIHALAFAPDGLRAAAGGKKGTIVVWDVDG